MTASQAFVRVVTVSMFTTFLLSTPIRAAVSCHKINAKGVGQDLGGGTTQAQILGGGLLQGTTLGNFAITGVSGSVASFTGTVTFTTRHGTLVTAVNGTFNLATGEFSAAGPVSASTGKLAGAAGSLELHGIQDATGAFVEDVTGEICVDLSPEDL